VEEVLVSRAIERELDVVRIPRHQLERLERERNQFKA